MRIRRGGKYAGCAAALCLLAVLALCGCQKKQAALPPDFGGKKVLRVAVVQPGACLDVQRSDNPEVALIADEVAEGLFRFTDERLLEPALAEDFPEISEDGLEYRFVLKPGLCFSDGTALTAEDVRFSLTRLLSPETASPAATYFSMIDGALEVQRGESSELRGITVQDDRHFTVRLQYPYAPFLKNLGLSAAAVYPKAACEAAGDGWGKQGKLLGAGPFLLKEQGDRQCVLVRNEKYHGTAAKLDEIRVLYYKNDGQRFAAYRHNKVDFTAINAAQYRSCKKTLEDEVHIHHPVALISLRMNPRSAKLKNSRLRWAMTVGLARRRCIDKALDGAGLPASSLLHIRVPGHNNARNQNYYDYKRAREAVEEAGYYGGQITLTAVVPRQNLKFMREVKREWEKVGIGLKLEGADEARCAEALNDPQVDLVWQENWYPYPEGDQALYPYFHSANLPADALFGRSDEVDCWLDDARREPYEPDRAVFYAKADQLLSKDDCMAIPLYYPQCQYLMKPYVKKQWSGNLIYHFWDTDIEETSQEAAEP